MNQRLLAEIGRTQRLEIVNSLKRTKGMSVNELVEKMGMSYMTQLLPSDKNGPQILECHSPIFNLLEKFPLIGRLEQDMFEAVLGTSVRREETRTSGLFECAFYFAA